MRKVILVLLLFVSSFAYSQDTVKVIMLYSDTALTDLYGVDDEGMEYIEIGFDEACYWRRGYLVGELFLDEDKQRIPSSNIVWTYKKIK